jgi:hypothetical protein
VHDPVAVEDYDLEGKFRGDSGWLGEATAGGDEGEEVQAIVEVDDEVDGVRVLEGDVEHALQGVVEAHLGSCLARARSSGSDFSSRRSTPMGILQMRRDWKDTQTGLLRRPRLIRRACIEGQRRGRPVPAARHGRS